MDRKGNRGIQKSGIWTMPEHSEVNHMRLSRTLTTVIADLYQVIFCMPARLNTGNRASRPGGDGP